MTGLANPKEAAEHKDTLKLMLRWFKWLLVLVSDPDFKDRSLRRNLEGMVWQAEQSWKQLYEPLPEAEADKILSEVFPNEPRA